MHNSTDDVLLCVRIVGDDVLPTAAMTTCSDARPASTSCYVDSTTVDVAVDGVERPAAATAAAAAADDDDGRPWTVAGRLATDHGATDRGQTGAHTGLYS